MLLRLGVVVLPFRVTFCENYNNDVVDTLTGVLFLCRRDL